MRPLSFVPACLYLSVRVCMFVRVRGREREADIVSETQSVCGRVCLRGVLVGMERDLLETLTVKLSYSLVGLMRKEAKGKTVRAC